MSKALLVLGLAAIPTLVVLWLTKVPKHVKEAALVITLATVMLLCLIALGIGTAVIAYQAVSLLKTIVCALASGVFSLGAGWVAFSLYKDFPTPSKFKL